MVPCVGPFADKPVLLLNHAVQCASPVIVASPGCGLGQRSPLSEVPVSFRCGLGPPKVLEARRLQLSVALSSFSREEFSLPLTDFFDPIPPRFLSKPIGIPLVSTEHVDHPTVDHLRPKRPPVLD